jgi:LmbE family N-acetylglucosaminyl deacetylase
MSMLALCMDIARPLDCFQEEIGSTAKSMSRPDYAQKILNGLGAGSSLRGENSPNVLFLAAHPDDETIGASAVLGRLSNPIVIFMTDGAPRDPKFRSPHVSGSRETYALVRTEEAASALALVGVPPEHIMFLNAVDQESIYEVPRLVDEFVQALTRNNPDIIITHPYEGGHPDHDTAALIASLAIAALARQGRTCPERFEFTSYHAVDGHRASGEFLRSNKDGQRPPHVAIKLSGEERARKARMLGCYVSQWHVLSEFPLEPECLRIAPEYDFTKPPHEGSLWYECLGWALHGNKWRELASTYLTQDDGAPACH